MKRCNINIKELSSGVKILGDVVICDGQCFNYYEVVYPVLNSIYSIDESLWCEISCNIGERDSFSHIMERMDWVIINRGRMNDLLLNNEFLRYLSDNYYHTYNTLGCLYYDRW